MNVTRENIDKLNARIKVQVVKEDYTEKVDKVLRDYKKKPHLMASDQKVNCPSDS